MIMRSHFSRFEVLGDQRREVRGALLLFALVQQLDVDRRLNVCGLERIERREHGLDRGLVVAGSAGEEPPIRIEGASRILPVDGLGLGKGGAHRRLKRARDPALLADRLAVIVCVEEHRTLRARDLHLGEDRRRRAGLSGQEAGLEAARLQLALDVGRVLLDVGDVGRDVGHRK
jgi:hypothetical protein